MKWASAISEHADAHAALAEVVGAVRAALAGATPDLVIVFTSAHHEVAYPEVPPALAQAFPGAVVLGCSANGVIGAGHEVERRPALSLTAAVLPGVGLRPFAFDQASLPESPAGPHGPPDAAAWRKLVGIPPADDPQFLLLCDPFTFDADALIAGLDAAYPSGRKVGGLVSGGTQPGTNALYLGSGAGAQLRDGGAVGVAMIGDIAVDTIVAQGCRPIGVPLTITRCERNVVLELDGKSPLTLLRALFESLDERDQQLFRTSLFVGLEMHESSLEYKSGELLTRNLVGMDPDTGAIVVGAEVHRWKVLRFLLRDARTAELDLVHHLDRFSSSGAHPEGALLFSCLGRGAHLFGRADHDTDLFRQRVGAVPLGGFFCNGEIGPVGGMTFLHGYTSAFGLFRPKRS
jgi:small ligand-binding sensory domain FIST